LVDIRLPATSQKKARRELLDAVYTEIKNIRFPAEESLIVLRYGSRWIPLFETLPPLFRVKKPFPFKQGTCLISGGLGGIAYSLGKYLSESAGMKLILIGRTALPPRSEWKHYCEKEPENSLSDKIKRLQELEKLSPKVLYFEGDITDPNGMRKIIDIAEKQVGRISGIIHAAGTADGALIQRGKPQNSYEVLCPKVEGALTLHQLFKNQPLDFFVMMSSLSVLLPGAGQAAYVAANNFLDQLVQRLAGKSGCRYISINWQAWQERGMAVDAIANLSWERKQTRRQYLKCFGISPEEGVKIFARILSSKQNNVIVSPRDLACEREECFKEFPVDILATEVSSPLVDKSFIPRPALSERYIPPRNDTDRELENIWRFFLNMDKIGIDDSFFDLGGDSLKAINLLTKIRSQFHVNISLNTFFEKPTIRQIAGRIGNESEGLFKVTFKDEYVTYNQAAVASQTLFCFPPYVCYGLAYYELSTCLSDYRMHCFNYAESDNLIDAYIEVIRSLQPEPPYILFAYSAGGRLAFEVAKAMNRKGYQVSDLILLDSFSRWKSIDYFSHMEEEQRSDRLLSQFDYLFCGATDIKNQAITRLIAYSRLMMEIRVNGQLDSNIHLVKAEAEGAETDENRDWYQYSFGNSWALHCSGRYREYVGKGQHMVMLFPEEVRENAKIVARILETV